MTTFKTSRELPATPEQVFAAISNPERLARWWGPAGFTNTFSVFEFKSGGRWSFIMHGPDGKNYPNENVFAEIQAPHKVVIKHVVEPIFSLTLTLAPTKTGAKLSWVQVLESDEIAKNMAHIIEPANEQNLDRLTAELARAPGAFAKK